MYVIICSVRPLIMIHKPQLTTRNHCNKLSIMWCSRRPLHLPKAQAATIHKLNTVDCTGDPLVYGRILEKQVLLDLSAVQSIQRCVLIDLSENGAERA